MSRNIRQRLMTSAMAVALSTSALTVVPVLPAAAQNEPDAPIIPVNTPVSNKGPVVKIASASYGVGSKLNHKFSVSDPEDEGVKTVFWTPHDGFSLKYVDGDDWLLLADGTQKPGEYEFEFQGEDIHGQRGDVVTMKIIIIADQPPVQPTPQPTTAPTGQGPVVNVQGGTFDNSRAHTISFTVTDPQGDHIHQVWWYPIPGATMRWVTENKWEVNIAKGAPAGKYDLRLWAIDNKGNKGDEVKVPVTIIDNNAPAPQPTNNPNPGVNSGPTVQINPGIYDNRRRNTIPFKVVDPDGDWVSTVWWQPIPNASLRHVEGNNWEIVIEPGLRPGKYNLKIWAKDEKGNQGPDSNTTVTITGNPVNAAPQVNDGWIRMWGGYPYTYEVPVSDPDGDRVSLRIVEGNKSWMRFDGNKLVLTPSRNDVGHHRIVIEASDGQATDRATYDIHVQRFNY